MEIKKENAFVFILRCVILLPVSLIVASLISKLVLFMSPYDEKVGTIDVGLSHFSFWYCFYKTADYIAPNSIKKFSKFLSLTLCCLDFLLYVYILLLSSNSYQLAMTLSKIIAACVAFYLILKKEAS